MRAKKIDQLGKKMNRSEPTKYWAFISYSHKDKKWAKWLQRKIESYRLPANLVGENTSKGKLQRKITPVFLDESELPATSDLGAVIRTALRNSQSLIVLCSRNSESSKWVNEEVRQFIEYRGKDHIVAVIVDVPPDNKKNCEDWPEIIFCPSLRDSICKTSEPLAAELSKDKRLGFTRVLAGVLDIGLDELLRRERTRTMIRLVVSLISLIILIIIITFSIREYNLKKTESGIKEVVSFVSQGYITQAITKLDEVIDIREKYYSSVPASEYFMKRLLSYPVKDEPEIVVLPVQYGCFHTHGLEYNGHSHYRRIRASLLPKDNEQVVDVVGEGELMAIKSERGTIVRRYDTKTGQSQDILVFPTSPLSVRISPTGDTVLVLDSKYKSDDELDTDQWTLEIVTLDESNSKRPILVRTKPNAISYTNDGKYAIVATVGEALGDFTTDIYVIDVSGTSLPTCHKIAANSNHDEIVFIVNHPTRDQFAMYDSLGGGLIWDLQTGDCSYEHMGKIGNYIWEFISVDYVEFGGETHLVTVAVNEAIYWDFGNNGKGIRLANGVEHVYLVDVPRIEYDEFDEPWGIEVKPYFAVNGDIYSIENDDYSGLKDISSLETSGISKKILPAQITSWVGESAIESNKMKHDYTYTHGLCMNEERSKIVTTYNDVNSHNLAGLVVWEKREKEWVEIFSEFDKTGNVQSSLKDHCGANGWYPLIEKDKESANGTVEYEESGIWARSLNGGIITGLSGYSAAFGWWPFFASPLISSVCNFWCMWSEVPFITMVAVDHKSGLVFAGGNLATFQVWSLDTH